MSLGGRPSAAQAVKRADRYGTAEAVPFVSMRIPIREDHGRIGIGRHRGARLPRHGLGHLSDKDGLPVCSNRNHAAMATRFSVPPWAPP